jgi:hypothetical protein
VMEYCSICLLCLASFLESYILHSYQQVFFLDSTGGWI